MIGYDRCISGNNGEVLGLIHSRKITSFEHNDKK